MAKKHKYYVVWKGHIPGIYDNWDECKSQILNFPNARYKSFPTEAAAYDALIAGPDANVKPSKGSKVLAPPKNAAITWNSWSVDAACSGNPGIMEYRGVHTKTKQEVFRMGPYDDATNNVGEFLALVHALALLKNQGNSSWPVYTDSRTGLAWLRKKKTKTTLKKTAKNQKVFELLERAELWLGNNTYANPIYKWDTKNWGEIPADFGRK